ncbi:dag protein chloroplastic [Phtheirospermum japonicum]|uniref:Dag protein chloroplastic n=1 Tax=Phtheirospermum japonicum TaxID=374723 RepID=A0A830CLS7_9LAMI|nr:dag protein chloroplastic [Phtheirospermum japonicum]
MALRLRRVFSLSYPLLSRSLHQPKPISLLSSHILSTFISTTCPAAVIPSSTQLTRSFTSTSALFAKTFDPETDEIGPDTILFEGCDYNHWLITVDFEDSDISREQKIETYVNIAAQVFGSVEEAKKRIYALSTTTYQGFQVECPENVSDRFKDLPGVVFVLPDSYIDPANKEYGGDKYVNGEITPRSLPVHYGHGRQNRNYGPPRQQNNGPPQQQSYGPPQQQNYGPPQQQSYGPPPQQSYGPPPQQNYGPPRQQNYAPRPQQNYVSPPQQGYMAPQQQGYGSQQNYGPQGSGDRRNFTPPSNNAYQGSFDRTETRNQHAEGQRDFQQGNFQSHVPPQQGGFSQDAGYGSSRAGSFEQVPGEQRNFSSTGNN